MIQVREYALLSADPGATLSLDHGVVSPATFEWLSALAQSKAGERILSLKGPHYLKLDSFVGYLESPAGEGIEVLPKTGLGTQNPEHARQILCKMLCSALHLKPQEAQDAALRRMETPLHEWLYAQFLQALNHLVARGLRFDYERVEEECQFIRGQLDMPAQLRQPPGRANVFHIRHDIYSPERVENRLLKTALEYVYRYCRHPENWRLANELIHLLEPVTALRDPLRFLPQWTHSKLLQMYQPVKPWCELILEQLNPNFQQGLHRGIALMFPMEKLFEAHVAAWFNARVQPPWKSKVQAASEYLVTHQPEESPTGQDWFNLQPDLVLLRGDITQVLDTKWKLLDSQAANGKEKYGLSQQDFYQMYAYGQKYQAGTGDMMLIYPRHSRFSAPLSRFDFDEHLRLWVVPFCIETDQLICGDWVPAFDALNLLAASPLRQSTGSALSPAGTRRDQPVIG